MLALNASDYMRNQSSVANDLLKSLKKSIKDFISKKNVNKRLENIKNDFIAIVKEGHVLNAEIETARDFIDNYYINDLASDEIILNKYSHILEKLTIRAENILDKLEKINLSVSEYQTLYNAYDKLYSNLVNTTFAINQKIAIAYFDSKSNISILQEV